ncbi:sulfotransferase family protein [Devosia sp.]|uniref:sulfotransferase family protein n=1 Tax=Devosia sp. TaxID=1871048 RepID=UPI001AC834B4|nr:sulfotransferase family protein [Devosia sp.]MBN9311101.1 hypothetical protein [Devosia sp.]
MALDVIGFGVGRTGTFSLKLALEQLGFGPCHHMEEVDPRAPQQIADWRAAIDGRPDWAATYRGYRAAVDWPTAAFCSELVAAYPDAKFLLTVRDPEDWYASFSGTIARLLAPDANTPADLLPLIEMAAAAIRRSGFEPQGTRQQLLAAFAAHTARVMATVPAGRLLVFDIRQGWSPLCRFLGVEEPPTPFPRSNSTREFWQSVENDANAVAAT